MTIRGLRILPPLAIARMGSAAEPLDNYTVEEDPDRPLDFRRIVGAETLVVDRRSGEILEARIPTEVAFKDGERIRPVAPFLEVFAVTDGDVLEPLTLDLLREHGLDATDVSWRVSVANRKVVRRTENGDDLVAAETSWFSTHDPERLRGHCPNFVGPDRFIDFGSVRYIRPNAQFPEIRLRFTPAAGLIYGPDVDDPEGLIPPVRRIYDSAKKRGKKENWYHYEVPVGIDNADPDYDGPFYNETLPPSLFAIVPPAPSWLHGNVAISRGYLDDACDGVVEVALDVPKVGRLTAAARITSGPPVLVPDALFVRNLADDLEQVIAGPDVAADEPYEVTRARAEDILKRAYETARFLNVSVMNGNTVQGRPPLSLDTMPAEEAFDTERLERPVMAPGAVDTLAILALHEQVFAALRGGAAPWFVRLLRKPEEAADYTDEGRRKMPALMCGADNNYLALTHRQIDTLRAAATRPAFQPSTPTAASGDAPAAPASPLTPRNRSAQVHYEAAGNPISSRPINAIANCCPGLEVDFRAVWRRLFEGVVLREYDNLVVDVDPGADPEITALRHHRLLRVNGTRVVAQKLGPSPADPFEKVVLATEDNPDAVQPLEWSNMLARILHEHAGELVACEFTVDRTPFTQVWPADDTPTLTRHLRVRHFFEDDTAMISRALAQPGELTQGLCSPWQNDYRECSCYYWASARPDYVNVEPTSAGASAGDNWLQKKRTGTYVPDDYVDTRLILYDDLFRAWEHWLRFQIRGRDLQDDQGPPA